MDCMIDLETLGKSPGCGIQQIGVCLFDKDTDTIYETYEYFINKESCSDFGLHSDLSTLAWWEKQSDEAKELFNLEGRNIQSVLMNFMQHIDWKNVETVWAHGASFDIPILEAALTAVMLKAPWKYTNIRDTRTLFSIFPPDEIENELKHSALADAVCQAKKVQSSYKKLVKLNSRNGVFLHNENV